MSNFTRLAIMESFVQLSKEMPIEKITVVKITEKCGINRNTFYYYYPDVYGLLEEIIDTKMQKLFVLDEENIEDSWKASLRLIGQYAVKNEEFIKCLYQSMGRDAFGDKLTSIAEEPVYNSMKVYGNKLAGEDDLRAVTYVFAKAFSETAVDWIRGRLKLSPVQIMENIIAVMEGVPDVILKNILNKH